MAVQINLEDLKAKGPQLQWQNQLKVTISLGNRYCQRGEIKKAVDCYEVVLYYDPSDTKTRVKLSQCYKKLLMLENAIYHQNEAQKYNTGAYETKMNSADVDFELGKFEKSLISYLMYNNKKKPLSHCNQRILKIDEIIENLQPKNGIMGCLGSTVLNMTEKNQLDKYPKACQASIKSTVKHQLRQKYDDAYYLRGITENIQFFKKQLQILPKAKGNNIPIRERIRSILKSIETTKTDLYKQKPSYMLQCGRPRKRSTSDIQRQKDIKTLQIAKYINAIFDHCVAGNIELAQRQADLVTDYMYTNQCTHIEAFNTIYLLFGLTFLLVYRVIPEWSNELNEKRMLDMLGSTNENKELYAHVFQSSYFGPHDHDTGNTLRKLTKKLRATDYSVYKMYLQYERIKCYIKIDELKTARALAKQLYTESISVGSIAWQINALMMIVITESRLGNASECVKTLEFVVVLSRTLGNDEVTQFLRKMWQLFAESKVQVRMSSQMDKRKADIVDIMPDSEAKTTVQNLLWRLEQLPPDRRMPLLAGEPVVVTTSAVKVRGATRTSLIIGDQPKRLGELTLSKRTQLTIPLPLSDVY